MTNGTFIGVHATLWSALAVSAVFRAGSWSEEQQIPPMRNEPIEVKPLFDYEVVVTDEQLQRVLEKLKPPFEGNKTKINHIDHGLRFWTTAAKFDPQDKSTVSGKQMQQLLTDHRAFVQVFGEKALPLLRDVPTGVGTRVQEGFTTSSHVDHSVACLAEAGTPLDFPVYTPTRQTAFRELVEHTYRDFSLNQIEYEWSALTFALYLPPVKSWRTSEGQEMSFNRISRRIMRERLPLGVCFGNHRLHTLTMFLRVDDVEKILDDDVRQEVIDYLKKQTSRLVAHQHPDGYWNKDWPHAKPADDLPSVVDGVPDRILATGHALEWWALVPESLRNELHPPRPTLASAGQWLVREIENLSDEDTLQYYTYLTHAGRALALWRGASPADIVRYVPTASKPADAATKAADDQPADGQPTDDGNDSDIQAANDGPTDADPESKEEPNNKPDDANKEAPDSSSTSSDS